MDEFETELYDIHGRYAGRWWMGYLPEPDRYIRLEALPDMPPQSVHTNKNEYVGGETHGGNA